jgi:hypothetical protein
MATVGVACEPVVKLLTWNSGGTAPQGAAWTGFGAVRKVVAKSASASDVLLCE